MYTSIKEAQEARIDLIDRISSIDVQLSERKEMINSYPEGADVTKYIKWRSSAMYAKLALLKKLSKTKLWLKENEEPTCECLRRV